MTDVNKELKKEQRRLKFEIFKERAKDWWDDNKGYVLIFGPAALGFGANAVKAIGKHHNLKMEERNKDLRVYDISLGHYWELKRKLNNRDWTYINNERDRGVSLGKILDEMRVLK